MMNAGTRTTTAALKNTIYLLFERLAVLAHLGTELVEYAGTAMIPAYDVVSSLPYLRACIEEAIRLRPASSMGLPRVIPKGRRTIAGRFIDEDVTVSVPTYTLLRNKDAFNNPEEFDPEHWISGDGFL